MYKFKKFYEEKCGIDQSKFPSFTKSPFLSGVIQTILKRASGDNMQKVVTKLNENDKEIGRNLLRQFERLKSFENDPGFKLVKKLNNCKSYKKEVKGERIIYKCQGEIPLPLIDIVAFLSEGNETKSWYDKMFVKEDLLRNIHPDIKIIKQAYKAQWPTTPRI